MFSIAVFCKCVRKLSRHFVRANEQVGTDEAILLDVSDIKDELLFCGVHEHYEVQCQYI
jgi:hypothetical protein